MLRKFQPSKQTEDRVRLAKQFIECTPPSTQPNINLFSLNSTTTKLLGKE